MLPVWDVTDTIVAIVTAAGPGGVAIVRLSGPGSLPVLKEIFCPKKESRAEWESHRMRYGRIQDKAGRMVDEVLAVYMQAPGSYTGEDVAEIHTHGGSLAARAVLEICLALGVRLAEPGEFTKRAFCNNRMDLTQAEAVCDLVNARTECALRAAAHQLAGSLSREMYALREALMTVLAGMEALLNFPEDDTDRGQIARMRAEVSMVREQINALLLTAREGQVYREGVRLVLCGKPNAGKSSLLNVLLKRDRAIVTDIPGTTRDTIEETMDIHGVPVIGIDTAGILVPRNRVEEEAVRRSREGFASADLILLVLDGALPLDDVDQDFLLRIKDRKAVVVINKADLPQVVSVQDIAPHQGVMVSAVTGQGVEALKDRLAAMALGGAGTQGEGLLVTNERHITALRQAADDLGRVLAIMERMEALDVVVEGLKSAIVQIDKVTGHEVDVDLIDRIFSRFCIGK